MKQWAYWLLAAAVCLTGCSQAAVPAASTQVISSTTEVLNAEEVVREDASAMASASPTPATPAEVGIHAGTGEDYTEDVLRSSSVHIRNGKAYLAYKDQILSASLDEDGGISEASVVLDVMPTINTIAGDGLDLYLATNDGIFRLAISDLEDADLTSATLLSELDTAMSPFYVWENWLFFLYDHQILVVPKSGGDVSILADGVNDFQVTNRGLFWIDENGALKLLSFEDGETNTLMEDGAEGRIAFQGDTAFVSPGQAEARVFAYDAGDRQLSELGLSSILSASHGVWPEPGGLLCQTEDGRVIVYDMGAHSETELGTYNMPYYEEGQLEDGLLYNMSGDALTWMHLDTGETGEAMLPDLLSGSGTD